VQAWRARLGRIETQVCRVEVVLPGEDVHFATGFLLGPDIMMTCYNVLERVIKGEVKPKFIQCRFDYKLLEDGVTPDPGIAYPLAKDWLVDYSRYSQTDLEANATADPLLDELDYVLMRLAGSPGREPVGGTRTEHNAIPRGWINLFASASEIKSRMPLFIVHHPESAPLKVTLDTDAVIGLNANGTRVRYRTSTEAGSAGAPCFDGNWNLVAMHHASDPNFELSHKAAYNQGIPMAAILRLLEQRGKRELLRDQDL
jgi:hypothetical protein